MTTIQDTVTYIDGRMANGKIILTWPILQVGGVAIAAGQDEWPVVDGQVSITVYPNINAQPLGVYYTATYELDEGAVYDEFWIVPDATTVTIATVRAQFPTTPSVMINAMQLTSSGAAPGMILGWNGTSWVPMFISDYNAPVQKVFGRTGQISAQTGDYSVEQVTGAVGVTRRINTVLPLQGGGDLSQDLTLSVNATDVVPGTRQVIAGFGLTGGGPLTSDVTLAVATSQLAGVGLQSNADGTLSVVPETTAQLVQVALAGTVQGTQPQLNFLSTPGANFNVVNVPGSNRVDVSVSLTGTGPASPSIFSVNGAAIGTQPELNLIAGSGTTITGVDDTGLNRVDVTIQASAVGGVSSFNTRTGAVLPAAGDYTAALVTNAVDTTQSYANPSWITSLPWGKITGAPAGASFWQGGSGGAIYYSGGNVGIGTSNIPLFGTPTAGRTYVTITGSSNAGILELAHGAADASGLLAGQVSWTDPNNNQSDKRVGAVNVLLTGTTANNRGSAMVFYTRPDASAGVFERMRIDQAGNVGIGNTVVLPDTGTNDIHLIVGPTTGSALGEITVSANQPVVNGGIGAYNFANYANTGAEKRVASIVAFDDGAVNSGKLVFYIWNSGTQAESMVIRANGNVGIGTDSPQAALDVFSTNNGDLLALHGAIASNGDGPGILLQQNNYSNLQARVKAAYESSVNGMALTFWTYGGSYAERMRITGNGAVGIGTTNPGYTCQVTGSFGVITNANTLARSPFLNQNTQAASRCDIQIGAGSQNIYFGTQVTPGAYGWGEYSFIDSPGPFLLTASQVFMYGRLSIGTSNQGGSSVVQVHVGANENLTIGGPISVGGSVSLAAVNDAFSANTPLEIRANPVCFLTGPVKIGSGAQASGVGDLGLSRDGSPTTAAIYFGNNASLNTFLYYDGTNFNFSGGQVLAGIFHATSSGYYFPDGTLQSTAAVSGGATTTITWYVGGTSAGFSSSGNSTILNFIGSGQASTGSSVAGNELTYTIFSASDERTKQNIEPLVGGLATIEQIRPVHAEWNGALGKPKGEPLAGVIAQEIADVLPEAVYAVRTKLRHEDEEETDVLGLEPMAIVAHLILAVQQLKAKVEKLEKRRN